MIDIRNRDGYVHLIINRPQKRNALTRAMYHSLGEAIAAAACDPGIHAIVLSGNEGVFTAGNDLDDFRARATDPEPKPSAGLAFIDVLRNCNTPVIAAVEGLAIGIGTTLLLHCDLVVAGRSATFKTAFVDLGLVPEAGSTVTMPLHLGSRRAAELLLLGDVLNGEEACRCGLVSRVVEDGKAVEVAESLAQRLAAKPRDALLASKELLRAPWRTLVAEAMARESQVFARRLRSDECRAALARLQSR